MYIYHVKDLNYLIQKKKNQATIMLNNIFLKQIIFTLVIRLNGTLLLEMYITLVFCIFFY